MIPRYAIIDEFERDEFEKKWHMPYGYGTCYITADPEDAIEVYEEMLYMTDDGPETSLIIEEFTENSKTLFYRK